MGTDQADPERHIDDLFAGEGLQGREADLDSRVNAALDRFRKETSVSTEVSFDSLSRRFDRTHIPTAPEDVTEYFRRLTEDVVAHSINTASPRFIGHMTTSLPYFVGPLAKLLTALNQNLVKVETSKALTPYEREALGMMHRLIYQRDDEFYERHLQNKESTLGIVTSGGTSANMSALWIARNWSLGHDSELRVESAGLVEALRHHAKPRSVVFASTLVHYSVEKAADLLGFGTDGLRRVPVDERGRLRTADLRSMVESSRTRGEHVAAIIGVAGTTDSGAIDPLEEIAEIARATDAHFHVDAAWGGALLFSNTHRDLVKGIELADSVTIDGHKQLYLPMGIGMVLLKDPHKAEVIERQAPYIIRPNSGDLGRRSLEGSRPAMALYLHAALHILGKQGLGELIDQGMRRASYLAKLVDQREEFELLTNAQMNIVNYRYVPSDVRSAVRDGQATPEQCAFINGINERLQERQRDRGETFVSRTTLRFTRNGGGLPVTALRAVIANPLTTEADIDQVVEDQLVLGQAIERE